jgi:voltage-gated potassium channel Kch
MTASSCHYCRSRRVGSYVAHVLKSLNVTFVAIEFDSANRAIEGNRNRFGIGDAGQSIVLNAARIEQANL